MQKIFFILLNICLIIPGIAIADFNYPNQDDNFWRQHLDSAVYNICRLQGTELPGSGKYNHFSETGTYYCSCCGGDHALYSSETKFDSGTGWPSFYASLPGAVIERKDASDVITGTFGLARTEVICARCQSHLGHVFNDGPAPTGKRYCMNSLALSFTAKGEKPKRNYAVE